MVTVWLAGTVHRHQTDAPPVLPAWSCSPDSRVAPTFAPVTERMVPLIGVPASRLSLAGAAESRKSDPNKRRIQPEVQQIDFMRLRQITARKTMPAKAITALDGKARPKFVCGSVCWLEISLGRVSSRAGPRGDRAPSKLTRYSKFVGTF